MKGYSDSFIFLFFLLRKGAEETGFEWQEMKSRLEGRRMKTEQLRI